MLTSLVAPSPPRTMPSASSFDTARRPASSAGYSDSSITTPLAPLASANTVSLVEHSPSTVMALNVSRVTAASAFFNIAGSTCASHVRKAEHRRHHRLDHARSPSSCRRRGTCPPPSRRCTAVSFGKRIGRHDGQHRIVMSVAASARAQRLRDAVRDLVAGQIDADDARRRDEHFLGPASELARDELDRRARDVHAGVAGARVRAAAVADNRPCACPSISRLSRETTTGAAIVLLVVKTAAALTRDGRPSSA